MAITTISPGSVGSDGFSPTVEIYRLDDGVEFVITDVNGTRMESVYDGAPGDPGISPTVEIARGENVTKITIEDANGIHETKIPDGATGPAGADGKDNLPNATATAGTEVTLTMDHNVEYQCSEAVTALTIEGFTPAENGKVSMWALQFAAGEGITVTVPDTVKWAVAEPVFTAGVTYWLTFVPLITGEILGVWVSNE